MTVSFDKAAVPTAQSVAALEIEFQKTRDALELMTHERDTALRQIGQRDAAISNLREKVEREGGEAYAARSKFAQLRTEARALLVKLIDEHGLTEHREAISEQAEAIGLDPLSISYKGTLTVRFNFEGLQKEDGSDFTEDDARYWLEASLSARGDFELRDYDADFGDIELELE
ncbi:hypothetical protein [Streptomyces sp. NPDC048623]|uniref:hypothetical protein n=1 Tax=Streptomyces sp. NPDC048623 TaxID=3155761 RepID=UPI00341F18F4